MDRVLWNWNDTWRPERRSVRGVIAFALGSFEFVWGFAFLSPMFRCGFLVLSFLHLVLVLVLVLVLGLFRFRLFGGRFGETAGRLGEIFCGNDFVVHKIQSVLMERESCK